MKKEFRKGTCPNLECSSLRTARFTRPSRYPSPGVRRCASVSPSRLMLSHLLAVLLLAGCVHPQVNAPIPFHTFETGPRSIEEMHACLEKGDPVAQYRFGQCCLNGWGMPKDPVAAERWFRKAAASLRAAAERGDAQAQDNLGIMYNNGFGVPKDACEAAKWCRKAAEQGYPAAQIRLGNKYRFGDGVPRDAAEAAIWYRKAAEQGDRYGQERIGWAYYAGVGVELDFVEAYKWMNLAAAQGDLAAKEVRQSLEQSMSSAHVAQAQRLSREFKPMSCYQPPGASPSKLDGCGNEKPTHVSSAGTNVN